MSDGTRDDRRSDATFHDEVPLPVGFGATVRRMAREESVRVMESVGVDAGSFEGRQRNAELLGWMRARKVAAEAGWSKAYTTGVGALVSAAIAGVVAYLSGSHK